MKCVSLVLILVPLCLARPQGPDDPTVTTEVPPVVTSEPTKVPEITEPPAVTTDEPTKAPEITEPPVTTVQPPEVSTQTIVVIITVDDPANTTTAVPTTTLNITTTPVPTTPDPTTTVPTDTTTAIVTTTTVIVTTPNITTTPIPSTTASPPTIPPDYISGWLNIKKQKCKAPWQIYEENERRRIENGEPSPGEKCREILEKTELVEEPPMFYENQGNFYNP